MVQKSRQSTTLVIDNQNNKRGKILGLKWYWWIAIVVGAIILMSFISVGVGGFNPLADLSNALLGFAAGILNLLLKSPIFWLFAAILLLPFIGTGLSGSVRLYKEHFGEGKSQADVNKELGIDADGLKALQDKVDKEFPNLSPAEKAKKVKSLGFQKVNQDTIDKQNKQLQELVDAGHLSYESAKAVQEATEKQANEKNQEDAKREGVDAAPLDSKPIEPAKI